MEAFEDLARRILACGFETGGRLDMGCFYCGGDDIEHPYTKQARATGTIIHAAGCLFVELEKACNDANL